MPVKVPGDWNSFEDPGDGFYDYRRAWGQGGWKNWFPYFTLTDCEALCRTTSNCVVATYIKDRDGPTRDSLDATLHGECFLHSGMPDIAFDCPNCVAPTDGANQMTITKRDTGRLN